MTGVFGRLGIRRRAAAVVLAAVLVVGVVPSGTGAQSSGDSAPVFAVALGSSLADVGAATLLVAAGEADAVLMVEAPDMAGPAQLRLLRAHGASGLVLVGGPAAISAQVEAELVALAPRAAVSRLWGADREATAEAVARHVLGSASDARGAVVALANGWSPADAAAAAAAVAAGAVDAVLWASQDALGDAAAGVLTEFTVRRVLVIGGPAALSEQVEDAAGAAAGPGVPVRRVGGATRTDTAVMMARVATAGRATVAAVADGWELHAAAQAATLAAAAPGAVVLFAERGGTLGDAARRFLADSGLERAYAVSGDETVCDMLVQSVKQAAPAARVTCIADPAAAAAAALEASQDQDSQTGGGSGGGGSGGGGGGGGGVVPPPPPTTVPVRGCTAPSVTLTRTAGGIDVSWTQTGAAVCADNGFTVEHRTGTGSFISTTKAAADRSHSLTLLMVGRSYEVQVTARSSAHGNNTSAVQSLTVHDVPASAPTGLTVTATGHNQVTATWTAATGTTGRPVNNHTVRWKRTTANTYTTAPLGATATTRVLTGLTAGSSYHVNVGATNSVGTTWNASDTTVKACDARAVSGLTVASGDASFTASWAVPSSVSCALTKIVVQYKKTGTTTWTSVDKTATDTSHTQSSLDNGVAYDVRVKTVNNASLEATTTTAQVTPNVDFEVWFDKNTQDLIPQMVEIGGVTKAGWQLFFQTSTNLPATAVCRLSATETASCLPGTRNSFAGHLDATGNQWGQGKLLHATATSIALRTSTSFTMRGSYEIGGPGGAEFALSAGNAKIAIGWEAAPTIAPGSTITGYRIHHRAVGTSIWTTTGWLAATARTHTLTSLTNGTAYQVAVQARSDNGTTGSAKPHFVGFDSGRCAGDHFHRGYCRVTPAAANTGRPGAPSSTSVTAGDDQLSVNWSAPTAFTGPDVHAYSIRHKVSTANDSTYVTNTTWAGATSFDITGLSDSTAYTVQIRAENAAGNSAWTTIGTTHTTT